MGTGKTTKEQHEGDFLNHGAVLCHDCEGGDTNLCNKTHRTVQQNKMSFVVYKLKTNNQKQNLEGRLWVTLSIWFPAATLAGCVNFSESLNLSLPLFPNL